MGKAVYPWAEMRQAAEVGKMTLREIADTYRAPYSSVMTRAASERWEHPTRRLPDRLVDTMPTSAAHAVDISREERALRVRDQVLGLVSSAVEKARMAKLSRWDDLKTALAISDKAGGLDRESAPQLSVVFGGASDAGFVELPAVPGSARADSPHYIPEPTAKVAGVVLLPEGEGHPSGGGGGGGGGG